METFETKRHKSKVLLPTPILGIDVIECFSLSISGWECIESNIPYPHEYESMKKTQR